jgi:predicted transcriptional regulator
MTVRELAQHNDLHCSVVARGLINLLNRGLVEPPKGMKLDEAIADLEQQIASGCYR